MVFTILTTILVALVLLTIALELRRAGTLTLLALLSLGNFAYSALTPIIFYYLPDSAPIFNMYVSDAGMDIQESGLIRVVLAATVFQLICLGVSMGGRQRSILVYSKAMTDIATIRAAIFMGWVMALLGVVGVIWLGVIYNGHLWGLYEITYAERSALSRANSLQAFMLLLGIYGVSQLIVVFLSSGRFKIASLILLVMVLHGIGMKSKFPIFWVLIVFSSVAIGRKKEILQLLLPIVLSALILSAMSMLRNVENLSLSLYVEKSLTQFVGAEFRPWENDIPGPASMAYFIINNPTIEYTAEPLMEVAKLLIPKFVLDRGPVLADVWAEKMYGNNYEPGMGFGWSPIFDGYLLGGWLGISLVAVLVGILARYIDDLGVNSKDESRDFFIMVGYSCTPFFLYAIRESMGGLIKQMLIVTALIWLPTYCLSKNRKSWA